MVVGTTTVGVVGMVDGMVDADSFPHRVTPSNPVPQR